MANEVRRNETVRALDDLPGVPQGTRGRVELVEGFTWTRYRIAFDNGVDLGSIDGSHLSRPKDFEAALARREQVAVAEEVASSDGEGEEVGAAATGDEKVVNGVSVPAHLIERSQRARARLAA